MLYRLPVLQFIGLRGDILDGLSDLLGCLQPLLAGAGSFGGSASGSLSGGGNLLAGFASLFESGGSLARCLRDFADVGDHDVVLFGDAVEVRGRRLGAFYFGAALAPEIGRAHV